MTPYEVVLFLELVRCAHAERRLVYRRTRDKNMQTLIDLGWKPSDMLDFVAALRPESALGLPRTNQHPDHSDELVCEFGCEHEGPAIYVKIAVVGLESGTSGCVVSFHFAEKPFVFPFDQ